MSDGNSPSTHLSLLYRIRDPGDQTAWQEFADLYEPLVYRLARRRGLQDADAREVAQEVLVAVAGAIGRWEPTAGQGSFRSWLFRTARNLALNALIRQSRHPQGTGGTELLQLLAAQPAPSADDTALFEDEYRRQLFRQAAERIRPACQPKTWTAFWRTCVDGEAIDQVAAELDMPVGSVYAARSRVTARLSAEIRKLESTPPEA